MWPVSTKKSGVDVWLYAISLSLDHNAVSKVQKLSLGYPDPNMWKEGLGDSRT